MTDLFFDFLDTYLVTRMAGVEVLARAHSTTQAQPGKPLRFSVDMSAALFFDPESGKSINGERIMPLENFPAV